MKVAVLGPIAKDYIKIDGRSSVQIGGIPYYVSVALQSLGVSEVVPYVTCGPADNDWVKDNFPGLTLRCLPAEKTLESSIEYSSADPDVRQNFIRSYDNTIEPTDSLIKGLEDFDYIIFGPLFHDNIPFDLFYRLRHKNLILGNFGLFTYGEAGKFVRKNPEKLLAVLPYLQYLFLDRSEAEFVSGQSNVAAAARFLQGKGLKNMIITEGSKGSHLFIGPKYYAIPAYPPRKLADTTGAGDTYLAAFIRALELYQDPYEQGCFAAMVATRSLEEKGAFRGKITSA